MAASDDEFDEIFSDSEDTPDHGDDDDDEEDDEETRRMKMYRMECDKLLWNISESAGLPDPTPQLELLERVMDGTYAMNEEMMLSFNTRELPKALRALLNRQNLLDEEVANRVNQFVQQVLSWVLTAAEQGDKHAVENSTEELMKVLDPECQFYLHFGHWDEETSDPDSPGERTEAPEWRRDQVKVHEWIDARHPGSQQWMHALVIEEEGDRCACCCCVAAASPLF